MLVDIIFRNTLDVSWLLILCTFLGKGMGASKNDGRKYTQNYPF